MLFTFKIKMNTINSTLLCTCMICLASAQTILIDMSKYKTGNSPYDTKLVVFYTEMVKFLVIFMICVQQRVFNGISVHANDALYMIPSVCYVFQNIMMFYALSYTDPATYQIFSQSKVVLVGILTHFILKPITPIKQCALLLFALGMITTKLTQHTQNNRDVYGIGLVIGNSLISACSGILNEWLLKKNDNENIFLKNLRIYTFCVVTSGLCATNASHDGFNAITICIILVSAVTGICISFILRYAGNIVKIICTCISSLLTAVLTACLGRYTITYAFIVGLCVMSCASYLYIHEPMSESQKESENNESISLIKPNPI